LHLEYRYGYHFVAHDRLSRKNVLGGLKGEKRSILSICDGPQIVSFQFYRGRDVKTPTNYIYLDSTQWDLKNGTHILYQYTFGKNCQKAVKFFLSNNRKNIFWSQSWLLWVFYHVQHTKMCRIEFFTTYIINVISSELCKRR